MTTGWVRWQDDELEQLIGMAGDLPLPVLLKSFAATGSRAGWPPRTKGAVLTKLSGLHITMVPCGRWMRVCGLTAIGIPAHVAKGWLEEGVLPSTRFGGRRRYFQRSAVVALAQREPWRFAGIRAADLFLVLEDQELADSIALEHPKRLGPRPVLCVDTGRRFPSITAAARGVYCTAANIRHALRTPGATACGYRWRRL